MISRPDLNKYEIGPRSGKTGRIACAKIIFTYEPVHDMTGLSSLNTRCLHTNDKRLLRILLAAACLSLFLQKTFFEPDPGIAIRKSESVLDARVFFTPNRTTESACDVTVVTAFFDIGPFEKGSPGNYFTRTKYYLWSRSLVHIQNPLIVFTDSERFASHMKEQHNRSMENVRIILLNSNSSWAFKLRNQIEDIFNSPGYPKHLQNTVNACAQLAKYDVIARAAHDNYFKTRYFAWVDVGYLRESRLESKFCMKVPNGFDDKKIVMGLINSSLSMSTPVNDIFKENMVWVGGGLFLGEKSVIIQHEKQFKQAVDYFISVRLINTDQQVIYDMFSKEGTNVLKPKVELQIYRPPGDNEWFYLGTIMTHMMT
ncbi:hypothetical protein DPMN_167695 [Dreissena polymorpha]|uniref:Uncharacterized protein n=1 Tax=Dreissena polymorpha TaxID=45954 RepID=A0A9D4IYL1_DREPO|nr:hypothetical protein DPMN_167695 [Dreissena polymorpha]